MRNQYPGYTFRFIYKILILNEYTSRAIASGNSLTYVLANNERIDKLHRESFNATIYNIKVFNISILHVMNKYTESSYRNQLTYRVLVLLHTI